MRTTFFWKQCRHCCDEKDGSPPEVHLSTKLTFLNSCRKWIANRGDYVRKSVFLAENLLYTSMVLSIQYPVSRFHKNELTALLIPVVIFNSKLRNIVPIFTFIFHLTKIGWLVVFYGISTMVGYLMLNPLYTYIY